MRAVISSITVENVQKKLSIKEPDFSASRVGNVIWG